MEAGGDSRLEEAVEGFPSRVVTNAWGRALHATRDLEPGTEVIRFEGPAVPYDQVPPEEVIYAAGPTAANLWVIPQSDGRYLNHSCDPNSKMLPDRSMPPTGAGTAGEPRIISYPVVTTRAVSAGEALTITYNVLAEDEFRADPEQHFWDERWSFDCLCGAVDCQGRIDGYVAAGPQRIRLSP